jgi:4-amino-4-deoxy-L-arabinose transferase-like glycosyltransferase
MSISLSLPLPSVPLHLMDGVPGPSAGTLPGLRAAARNWLRTPARQVIALILVSLLLRMAFAGLLGLGVDESYMVAAGRTLALGYFDHPPASWWIVWGTAHLLGESEPAIRLPFILLFSLTTWLMYRVASRAYSPQAGVWCAIALNLSPALGVTTGTWVLPDGPLMAALAGTLLFVLRAVEADSGRAWRWWLGAGLCAGLAMLSKYTAVLPIMGFLAYLLISPRHRFWLRRAEPYAAGALALLAFAPVLLWNAQHGWASFAFQGARGGSAGGGRLHPLAPFAVLGGELLFLLPWIGIPLLAVLVRGLRARPGEWPDRMFAWLAVPAVVLFPLVALWSAGHVLFHWATPGFLMLFPPLGRELARMRSAGDRTGSAVATATAILLLFGAGVAGTEVRWNWLPRVGENFALGRDPDIQALDWTSLAARIMRIARQHPGLVVAATRWHECGKVSYALGPDVPFLCLAKDAREFGELARPKAYIGRDVLIVAPRRSLQGMVNSVGTDFGAIEPLPPAILLHAGRPAMTVPLFLGRAFHGT